MERVKGFFSYFTGSGKANNKEESEKNEDNSNQSENCENKKPEE